MTERHVAIVTGGAAGIGSAICARLVRRGVIVHSFDLREASPDVTSHIVDLDDQDGIVRALERIAAGDDVPDLLVNNGARAGRAAEHEFIAAGAVRHFEGMLATNVVAPFLIMHHVAARLVVARRSGRFVNMASAAAHRGGAGAIGYSAGKAAIVGMSRAAAVELGPRGISVNSVSPGYVATEAALREYPLSEADAVALNPLGRPSTPEEVAALVESLLLDIPATVTGADYRIDGGATIA